MIDCIIDFNQIGYLYEELKKTTNELHNQISRKYIDINTCSDWEIETDSGWSDISCVGKTIEYDVWEIKTKSGKSIKCADTHILFDETFSEIFAKDLNKDSRPDKIWVRGGDGKLHLDLVVSVKNLGYKENMYDIQVNDTNHRYYTNDILSHNSVFLCNDAAEFVRKGKNVLYITCEMSPTKVTRRIAANLFDITLEDYDSIVDDSNKIKKKLNNLNTMSMLPLGKLFIKEFPTGQGTVIDVERYIKEIEETQRFKVDVVIIDYINIMSNYRLPNSESTYLKIKQIAEDLRGIAVKYNLSIITATQCGRSALNGSDINMEDVAESMGLLHTVDTCFGIIQTDDMRMGSGNENDEGVPVPYYFLKILKIREGEGRDTKFKIDANYNKMKLIEKPETINTLSHLK